MPILIIAIKLIGSVIAGFMGALIAAIVFGLLFGSHMADGHDTINGGAWSGLLIVALGVVAGIVFWRLVR